MKPDRVTVRYTATLALRMMKAKDDRIRELLDERVRLRRDLAVREGELRQARIEVAAAHQRAETAFVMEEDSWNWATRLVAQVRALGRVPVAEFPDDAEPVEVHEEVEGWA